MRKHSFLSCRFRTDSRSNGFGIHLNGLGYPFKNVIYSNSLGYLFEKIVIRLNGLGYLFKKCCFVPENTRNSKIWHASEQNYFLFTSVREQYFQGVCKSFENAEGEGGKFWELILENPEGRGLIQQIPSMGVVWIFSRTTQFEITTGTVILSFEFVFPQVTSSL